MSDGMTRAVAFQVRGLTAVALDAENGASLEELFARCNDYFELTFGLPPGPAEVQSAFVALPEGKSYDDKFLLGMFDADRLTGHVDIIRDYPESGHWTLGLILLEPDARSDGLGTEVMTALAAWVRDQGGSMLRAGVVAWNLPALRYFERAGFRAVDRHEITSGVKRGDAVVFERSLGTRYEDHIHSLSTYLVVVHRTWISARLFAIEIVDLVGRRHGRKPNSVDGRPTLDERFAQAVTAIHQRPIVVEDDRMLEGGRVDPLTVPGDFAQRGDACPDEPAVLIECVDAGPRLHGVQRHLDDGQAQRQAPETVRVPNETLPIADVAVCRPLHHSLTAGK
jgi:RimJ/RimL family protein N-acetyltransferase